MQLLYSHDFPCPVPIEQNRHGILMSFVNGFPLYKIKQLEDPRMAFDKLLKLLIRFAENGLVHGDYNEFNLMVDDNYKIYVIDFPQMMSVDDENAEACFRRDFECLVKYFNKK